jgi:soluble lytic murein transglycosylase-like protein
VARRESGSIRVALTIRRTSRAARAALPSLLALAAWLPCGLARAEIYHFEDERGVAHFSDVPSDARYRLLWREPGARFGSLDTAAKGRYGAQILAAARRNGLDPALLHAVIQIESGYDARAVSPKGAAGLMQLMPETARRFGAADRFAPEENLEAGARYLGHLLALFEGDLELALAAYNAGEEAVLRHGRAIPPYAETRRYVPAVLARYRRAR